MKKTPALLLFLILWMPVLAEEGMWLPMFLKQYNEADMKQRGMLVTAEQIYSVNQSSMKDAVVLFGGGCTGEIISDQGLILTNHHCGFSQIQSHSNLEHNYLRDGFWAYNASQEIPCPGLTVSFVIRMEDVTAKILSKLNNTMSEKDRESMVKEISKTIEDEATAATHYSAVVKPFYNGNQYILIVQETFTDVRLVGAPPASIGKFGGDTDNWMWPRHTGDFSLFRVYASRENTPASYAADNIPLKPRYFFPVSLKGIRQGDFTMVYGFPGRTTEYIPSVAVRSIMEVSDPIRIKVRTARLEIIDKAMRSGEQLRIMYSAKQASIANGWKKWQGEVKGLNRLNTVVDKQNEERQFAKWVEMGGMDSLRMILPGYDTVYAVLNPVLKVHEYINEAVYGVEMIKYARMFTKLEELAVASPLDQTAVDTEAKRISDGAGGFFKNFDNNTDRKIFIALMEIYMQDVDPAYHPAAFTELLRKNKGDLSTLANELYSKSIFTDSASVTGFLAGFNAKSVSKLNDDPAYQIAKAFEEMYDAKVEGPIKAGSEQLGMLNRKYMAAKMKMIQGKPFYPDANSTLRVAYGQVNGYTPADGVIYKHFTTLEGVIEKENKDVEEFNVPPKLKELYAKKDYGQYGVNRTLPVAFIASNHTTGGNSGSPVLNANGELIGTNFDRVWEGTMSDIDFDNELCRNIALDIRYTLFVIDKYAGCTRLIEEMKIIK